MEELKGDASPTKAELYKIIRDQVVHEDNLNNHRMTWLLTSQSILFIAYYLVLKSTLDEDVTLGALIKLLFLLMLNTMGLLFSNFVTAKIWAGAISLRQLREFWFAKYPEEGSATSNNVLNNSPHYLFDDIKISPHKQFPDINFSTDYFDKDSEHSMLWNLISGINILLIKIQIIIFKNYYDEDRFKKSQKHGRALLTPLAFTLVLVWRYTFILTIIISMYETSQVLLNIYENKVEKYKNISVPYQKPNLDTLNKVNSNNKMHFKKGDKDSLYKAKKSKSIIDINGFLKDTNKSDGLRKWKK